VIEAIIEILILLLIAIGITLGYEYIKRRGSRK